MTFKFALTILGLLLFAWRLKPWLSAPPVKTQEQEFSSEDFVSIIIPCRNEQNNLLKLLPSLLALEELKPTVWVVDDGSTDKTLEVARSFENVRVIQAPQKPPGWTGKSWACWQAAQVAQSRYLLFTDADTVHRPDSLKKSLKWAIETGAELLTAPPYHQAKNFFERGLGLFHLIPLIATAYLKPPSAKRLYAIGQYLLIDRTSYLESGGHRSIASHLVEDIVMAKLYVKEGRSHVVYPHADLFEVQMFNTPRDFWVGWKRLLRLGMGQTSPVGFLETVLIFYVFWNLYWLILSLPFWQLISVLTAALGLLAWAQQKHGAFSFWGVFLAPFNVLLFIVISVAGAVETLLRRKVVWRDRSYMDS